MKAIRLELDTKAAVFTDFGYHLRIQCGHAPEIICNHAKGIFKIPFAGHTGPHEALHMAVVSSIDGMYQVMASATVRINPGASKARLSVAKFESKTGAFEPFEISLNYILEDRSLPDAFLDLKNNVCFSLQIKFYGSAKPEDLVFRMLDQTDICLGMCTLNSRLSSSLIVLSSEVSSSELQLSMTGEHAGVAWIPIRWGAPMAWVVPVDPAGYVVVTAHLSEGRGLSLIVVEDVIFSDDSFSFSDVLIHLNPLPLQSDELLSTSDVRNTEFPPDVAAVQQIVDGVKSAPVLSRSEISRGPPGGVYSVSTSAGDGGENTTKGLLVVQDGLDGNFENKFKLRAVLVGIKSLGSRGESNGNAPPVLSRIGYSLLKVANNPDHTTSRSELGIRRTLTGDLRPLDSGEVVGGARKTVTVKVLLMGLTARPKPTQQLPVGDTTGQDVEGDVSLSRQESVVGEKVDTEMPLPASDQLLHDYQELQAPVATPQSEETLPSSDAINDHPPNLSAPIAEDPPTLRVVKQFEPTPVTSKSHQEPALDPPSTSNSNYVATSTGAVGYPVNPRHALSSTVVMSRNSSNTAGGSMSNAGIMDTLTAELQTKQRIIDKLTNENSSKQELLKRLEKDVQDLKEENGRVKSRLADAHSAFARREQESEDASKYVQDLAANPKSFHHWDRELLVHLIQEAAVHIRRLESEMQGLRETVSTTEKMRTKYTGVCSQLSELQDAHLVQAKYLQKLQARVGKINAYEDTIKAQEEVITRMQSILETQLKSKNVALKNSGVSLTQSLLSRSQPVAKQEGEERAQVEINSSKIFAEEEAKLKKGLSEIKKKNERLKNELEVKNRRIESLEKQLVTSAHEASKEISKLRTALLDMELNQADTIPFDELKHSQNTGPEYNSKDQYHGSNVDLRRQQLLVPFESMNNVSFEEYVDPEITPSTVRQISRGSVLDEKSNSLNKESNGNVHDTSSSSFLRGGMKNVPFTEINDASQSLLSGTSRSKRGFADNDLLTTNSGNNYSSTSRPGSSSSGRGGVSRLESLVKPLSSRGEGMAREDDHSYYY